MSATGKWVKRLRVLALFLGISILFGCENPQPQSADPTQVIPEQTVTAQIASSPLPSDEPDPAPVEGNLLISSGETAWKYLDTVSDPANFWENTPGWCADGFNDFSWDTLSGSAGAVLGELQEVGGNLPINLLNQYGNDGKTNIPAFFFRTGFFLEQADTLFCLEAEIEYDDAISVYINGRRVVQGNTPSEGYSAQSPYGSAESRSPIRDTYYILNKEVLRDGWNVVAVELRQAADNSSDVFFDFISLTALEGFPNITLQDDAEPSSLVLQQGAKDDSLRLSWVDDTPPRSPVYLFWEEAASMAEGAFSTNCSIITPSMAHYADAGLYSYCAEIENIRPNTTYSYGIGNILPADVYTYDSPDYNQESFSFILAGDAQIREERLEEDIGQWEKTLDLALARTPDARFIISMGDQVNLYDNAEEHAGFAAPAALRSIPLVTVKGNHDEGDSYYNAYYAREDMYWFQYGQTLFVSIDTSHEDYERYEAFIAAAKKEYFAKNAREQDWLVLLMHHAIYSVGEHMEDENMPERRAEMTRICTDQDVDLALAGHDHSYARAFLMDGQRARTQPLPYAEDTKHPGEVLYLTVGSSSGSKYYELGTGDHSFAAAQYHEEEPMITDVSISLEGIAIRAWRVRDTLEPIDEFLLRKER